MTTDFAFTLEETSELADVRAVEDGLLFYNLQYVPDPQFQTLNIFMRDAEGRILGGLLGNTYWGWLYVSILWLDEALRKSGYGARILAMAESEALRRGCHHAHVDTLDIQAPGFYEKQGYKRWGTLENLPVGHKRHFYQKRLESTLSLR
jgi:GNAT superfamily N-acetyltransferase